jgi:hypothetical protein
MDNLVGGFSPDSLCICLCTAITNLLLRSHSMHLRFVCVLQFHLLQLHSKWQLLMQTSNNPFMLYKLQWCAGLPQFRIHFKSVS